MKALREGLTQQFQKSLAQKDQQIAQLKAAASGEGAAPTTPAGEGSASDNELKKKHAADMEKLKKVAALQMANFKKKVAAARSVELEKVRKEARAEAEKEFQQQNNAAGVKKSGFFGEPSTSNKTKLSSFNLHQGSNKDLIRQISQENFQGKS